MCIIDQLMQAKSNTIGLRNIRKLSGGVKCTEACEALCELNKCVNCIRSLNYTGGQVTKMHCQKLAGVFVCMYYYKDYYEAK